MLRTDGKRDDKMKTLLRLMLVSLLPLAFTTALSAQEYRIQTGDRLTIEVLEDESLNRTVTVLPGGTINFPYAGSINVSGAAPSTVGNNIAQALAGVLASRPTVFVTATPLEPVPGADDEPATINIYIMGEASAPGAKALPPGTTFLQALSEGGGLTPFAATKRIQLRRASAPERVIQVNYQAIMSGAAMNFDPVLAEGDVIIVPERKLFE